MRIGQSPYNNIPKPTAEALETQEAQGTAPQDEVLETAESKNAENVAPAKLVTVAGKNVNIDTLLRAFDIPDTPQGRELLRNMLSGGISATKENFIALSQILERFEGLTMRQAVFMAREEIPINLQNIKQFQGFLKHSNLVGSQLENILSIIGEEALPEQTSQTAQLAAPEVSDAPSPAKNAGNIAVSSQQQLSEAAQQQEVVIPQKPSYGEPIASDADMPVAQTKAQPQTTQSAQDAQNMQTVAGETIIQTEQTVQSQRFEALGDSIRQTPAQIEQQNQPLLPQTAAESDAVSQTALTRNAQQTQQTAAHQPALETTAAPESENIHEATRTAHQNTAVPQEMPESKQEMPVAKMDNFDSPVKQEGVPLPQNSEAAKETALNVDRNQIPVQEQSKEVAESEKLDKLITSLFKKVDPEHARRLPREMNAQTVVKELMEAVEAIKQKLPEMSEEKRAVLGKAVAELERNVDFLNKLSEYTPVVNVPLQWGKERTTAELYIFNDSKGKKKIDPQNATVFVSLMTANAGRVETMIKVIGKNVECDFSLEVPQTVNLVLGDMQKLSELLDNQGYRLARASALPAEKARDIFDVKDMRDAQKRKYFFDRMV